MDGQSIQTAARKAERLIIMALIVMMALVLVLATVDLAHEIVRGMLKPPLLILDLDDMLDLFGVFMLVLIGIELLDTIKVYFRENVVHVEVVMLVAMIAVARKVIVLEPEKYEPLALIGIGVLIIALAVGYYLIKRSMGQHGKTEPVSEQSH